jgi:hypothetical protein
MPVLMSVMDVPATPLTRGLVSIKYMLQMVSGHTPRCVVEFELVPHRPGTAAILFLGSAPVVWAVLVLPWAYARGVVQLLILPHNYSLPPPPPLGRI